MTLSLSDDYWFIDGLETVTYYVVNNNSGGYNTGVTVNNVLRAPQKKMEVTKDNDVIAIQVTPFHMWRSQLSSIFPKVNDKFTDSSSVSWRVEEVDVLDRDDTTSQRYRLSARRMKSIG